MILKEIQYELRVIVSLYHRQEWYLWKLLESMKV